MACTQLLHASPSPSIIICFYTYEFETSFYMLSLYVEGQDPIIYLHVKLMANTRSMYLRAKTSIMRTLT